MGGSLQVTFNFVVEVLASTCHDDYNHFRLILSHYLNIFNRVSKLII